MGHRWKLASNVYGVRFTGIRVVIDREEVDEVAKKIKFARTQFSMEGKSGLLSVWFVPSNGSVLDNFYPGPRREPILKFECDSKELQGGRLRLKT